MAKPPPQHPRHPKHPKPKHPGPGPGVHNTGGPAPNRGVRASGGPAGSHPAPHQPKPGRHHGGHPKHPVHPTHPHHPKPVKALPPDLAPRGGVPLFGNDQAEVCGPAAVATSLLVARRVVVGDTAVSDLYQRSGGHGPSGVWMAALMTAVLFDGLGGHRARVRLLTMMDAYRDGDVIELDGHAAVCLGGGLVLWGELRPMPARSPVSAWRLSW